MPKHSLVIPGPISKCRLSYSASPKTRISPFPKMGTRMSQAPFGAFIVRNERYIFIRIFGDIRRFPENGDKRSLSFEIKLLADNAAAFGSHSGGACARHGKEQQVVSCPPRRRRPGRLSLRSVRPSVERQDLVGGGIAPPTPSPSGAPGSRQLATKHAEPYVLGDAQ